jgi:hypothetical protein
VGNHESESDWSGVPSGGHEGFCGRTTTVHRHGCRLALLPRSAAPSAGRAGGEPPNSGGANERGPTQRSRRPPSAAVSSLALITGRCSLPPAAHGAVQSAASPQPVRKRSVPARRPPINTSDVHAGQRSVGR